MDFSRISSWSIKNPIPIILLFVVMTIGGLIGFSSLRVNSFPDIEAPIVAVTVVQPGAAPTELETQVTRLVEDSVAGLGQVKHITSTVNDSVSTTVIEFQIGVNIEKATNDVRNAVSGVRVSLPQDIQDPLVQRFDFTGQPILYFVVRDPTMNPEQLSWFVDNDIAKRLLGVKGVAQVERNGGVNREIRIKLDPAKLASLGVTAAQVSQQLRINNINLPGGRGQIGSTEQAIRTLGSASSIQELRDKRINLPNGSSVKLSDLGDIQDEWAEQRGLARFNGQEVVGFDVVRSTGSSEVDVAKRVRAEIVAMAKEHKDLKFEEVASTTNNLQKSYEASVEALGLGAILAVLVVWIFLRDWRATLITAVAMPLSLIPTFGVMVMFNQSLNTVSLLALSLTIGVLVDDAIVEIENIVRHMREGKKPYPAAMEAADEIGLAVLATTATLVAVFAPVGFMPGIVGQFFKSFAFAACVSVMFSLVVARTLTPLMSAYILRSDSAKEHEEPFWMPFYLRTLKWSLNHRWVIVAAGIAFFIASIFVATLVPQDFIPAEDSGRSHLSVSLPPGATLAETDATVTRVSQILKARKEVDTIYASIGSATTTFGSAGGSGAGEVRGASLTVTLKPKGEGRSMTQQEWETDVSKTLRTVPGARIQFGQSGGPGGNLFGETLVGDDPAVLDKTVAELERQMRTIPGLSNVFSSASLVRPELLITPKPDQAALLGVSSQDISQVARVATLGDADQLLPKFNLSDRQIPIRVMLTESSREKLDLIENLQVPTKTGTSVPLSAVADVTFGAGPDQINRQDRRRSATVNAELATITLGQASALTHKLPVMTHLPAGVMEAPNGSLESLLELVQGFGFAMVTGVLLMYVVLVLLFRSFADPFTIQVALPLSFGGAFLLLLLTGKSLSMPAFIGIIMLMGIAAKNSILLVDYGIMGMEKGLTRVEAMLDAGRKRARPIIMTTVAMAAGMLPIAIGLGTGSEFRKPMAIAVIGGLATSTLLSLLLIPVAFTLVDAAGAWLGRKVNIKPEGREDTPKGHGAPPPPPDHAPDGHAPEGHAPAE